jgi:glucose/arabinose dehydrogenase
VGYKVALIKLTGNKITANDEFATGWLQGDKYWGRPVDVLVMPDGALLVSDDFANCIYRISYAKS